MRVDPAAVLKLRCVFLKLRSGLELPLLRVLQTGDAAATALTDYYSSALLAYVCKVLQVARPPAWQLMLHYLFRPAHAAAHAHVYIECLVYRCYLINGLASFQSCCNREGSVTLE